MKEEDRQARMQRKQQPVDTYQKFNRQVYQAGGQKQGKPSGGRTDGPSRENRGAVADSDIPQRMSEKEPAISTTQTPSRQGRKASFTVLDDLPEDDDVTEAIEILKMKIKSLPGPMSNGQRKGTISVGQSKGSKGARIRKVGLGPQPKITPNWQQAHLG